MLNVNVSSDLISRLDLLVEATGRTKDFYVEEALQAHMKSMEDQYSDLGLSKRPVSSLSMQEIRDEIRAICRIQNSKVRSEYDARCRLLRDTEEEFLTAKNEGYQKGLVLGRAINMLQEGMPLEVVAECSGLSLSTVEELKKRYLGE